MQNRVLLFKIRISDVDKISESVNEVLNDFNRLDDVTFTKGEEEIKVSSGSIFGFSIKKDTASKLEKMLIKKELLLCEKVI